MALTPAVAGDIGDTRTLQLGGIDNLDAVSTVRAIVRRIGDTTSTILDAAVADSAECTVTVELGAADGWLAGLDAAGSWQLEVEATFANGDVLTWPQPDPERLRVRADLG